MQISVKQVMPIIYVISMSVAFTTKFGDIIIGKSIQLAIGALWIALAVISLMFGLQSKKNNKDIVFFIKLYFIPHVIIHIYTIILMICGQVDWKYLGTNVTIYIPTLLAITSIYFFGYKAARYNIIALICSYFLSVTLSVMLIGPHIIIDAIRVKNYLELHDVVLAAGYAIVFYIYTKTGFTKRNIAVLFLIVLIMSLGMKRVSILGLIISVMFIILTRFVNNKTKYDICLIAGIVGIILCYLFIYINKTGIFDEFLKAYSIESKGRKYYYDVVMSLIDFNVSFLGLGRNVVGEILVSEYEYLNVAGVHSDLIKMYAENGFVMYGLWLWYYLYKITTLYKKKYGYNPAVLYFALTIFMFVLYATDNTENYYICQIISISIPSAYAIKSKLEKEKNIIQNKVHK